MKKKYLITIISITLVLVVVIAGTLAWLTDRESVTNVFTAGNIDIELDEAVVDEYGNPLKKNDSGSFEIVDDVKKADRTEKTTSGKEGNHYHMVPGETYVKDPTMTIFAKNEPSYVRMLVKVNCVEQLDTIFNAHKNDNEPITLESLFTGYYAAKWEFVGRTIKTEKVEGVDVKKRIYEFRYINNIDNGEKSEIVPTLTKDTRLAPLFTELTIPGVLTKEELKTLENMVIEVEGHAVQAATFEADTATGKTAADVAWAAFDAQYAAK